MTSEYNFDSKASSPAAGKGVEVRRYIANGYESNTVLKYKFNKDATGSYREETNGIYFTYDITSYKYVRHDKRHASLYVDFQRGGVPTRHAYELTFNSATSASATLSANNGSVEGLWVTFSY